MIIQYLKRDEINTLKWDNCISRSVNGIAYAYSWYLDIVSEGWEALVGDDYKAVFPLTRAQKYGFDFLYQPHFAKQLGLFSDVALSNELLIKFVRSIPNHYKYLSVTLNTFLKPDIQEAKIKVKTTFHLDLIENYSKLSNRYSLDTKKNISIAFANGITIVKGLSAFQILELKKSANLNINKNHFPILGRVITESILKGAGELYGAYTRHNELCSAAFFLNSNSKAIYVLSATNNQGKESRAAFAVVDHFIHQNSEKHLVLDFEETNDVELEKFYKGFGAQSCSYKHLIINRLPWYVNIFKQPTF